MSGCSTSCSSMFMLAMRSMVESKSKPWNMLWWKCCCWLRPSRARRARAERTRRRRPGSPAVPQAGSQISSPRARVHHLDHELDDVPGRSELAVLSGGGDLAEHVLVQVALDVPLVQGEFVQDVNGLGQQVRRGDGEPRVLHVLGVRGVLAAESTQPREHAIGDDLVHLLRCLSANTDHRRSFVSPV